MPEKVETAAGTPVVECQQMTRLGMCGMPGQIRRDSGEPHPLHWILYDVLLARCAQQLRPHWKASPRALVTVRSTNPVDEL